MFVLPNLGGLSSDLVSDCLSGGGGVVAGSTFAPQGHGIMSSIHQVIGIVKTGPCGLFS